jgi:hypothetical protein
MYRLSELSPGGLLGGHLLLGVAVQTTPAEATRLTHVKDELGERYLIEGRAVSEGDPLEVWLPNGWLRGEFGWTKSCHSWPRLEVRTGECSDDVLLIVLAAGVRCRWPLEASKATQAFPA